MKQLPLAIGVAQAQTFATFFPGANEAALEHLRQAAAPRPPPARHRAVYLWGEPGSGKTHLLRALAAEMGALGGQCGWFDAVGSLPWTFDESWRLVVLDDCERLNGAQQQAAFALFVEAATHGALVAAAGRLPPVDLPLRDDLRTRLGWGHVFQLRALTEGERRSVLRREADRRGIFLSDEVMDYLLTRFARDLSSLMTLLDRLDRFALASKRSVTVPLIRQMWSEGNE